MKTISDFLKALRNDSRPVCRQLELPLNGRELTRQEQRVVRRLKRLRERIAAM